MTIDLFPDLPIESVQVADLRPHPRNYHHHPPDELEHLKASLRQHGIYRNIVIAEDNVILAGHGVVEACTQLGLTTIPVRRLPLPHEHPAALAVLVGDNRIAQLGLTDDRLLTEIVKQIRQERGGENPLVGTGFDDARLAALVMTTRPMHEIRDKDEAAHWVGMPLYEDAPTVLKLIISFRSEDDRRTFVERSHLSVMQSNMHGVPTWSTWWPAKEREDLASIRFEITRDA